jgi:hypothetical protein
LLPAKVRPSVQLRENSTPLSNRSKPANLEEIVVTIARLADRG